MNDSFIFTTIINNAMMAIKKPSISSVLLTLPSLSLSHNLNTFSLLRFSSRLINN